MKNTFTMTKATAFLLAAALVLALTGCANTTTASENTVYLYTERINYYPAPRKAVKVKREYDKSGRLLSENIAGERECRYSYDENGNILTEKITEGEDVTFVNYSYDDRGRMLSKEYVNGLGEIFSAEYNEWNSDGSYTNIYDYSNEYCESFYNADGNLTKSIQSYQCRGEKLGDETITEYWENGKIKRKESVLYNERGLPVAVCDKSRCVETVDDITKLYRVSLETGEEKLDSEYFTNADGLPTTVKNYSDNGSLYLIIEYEYYPSQTVRITRTTWLLNDGKLSSKHGGEYTDEYIENGYGKQISSFAEKYDENGTLINKIVWTFNNDMENRCSEIYGYGKSTAEITDENGRITVETYVIDSFGNVVGRERRDKVTGEKVTETIAAKKFGNTEYVTKSKEENITERTVVDKNGNIVEYESGLDFNGKKNANYSKITMKYKALPKK